MVDGRDSLRAFYFGIVLWIIGWVLWGGFGFWIVLWVWVSDWEVLCVVVLEGLISQAGGETLKKRGGGYRMRGPGLAIACSICPPQYVKSLAPAFVESMVLEPEASHVGTRTFCERYLTPPAILHF